MKTCHHEVKSEALVRQYLIGPRKEPRLSFADLINCQTPVVFPLPLRPHKLQPRHLTVAMSLSSKAATSLVRHATRQQAPALCALTTVVQRRNKADAAYDASTSHAPFTSPFHRGTKDTQDTTHIPSFKKYRAGSETGNKLFQYFMVGTLGGLSAMGAKDTVQSMASSLFMRVSRMPLAFPLDLC